MKKVIERLQKNKFRIILLYIYLDTPELAVDRVKTRVMEGGHNIPEEDVKRRYYRSKNNFWNYYKNLVDEWQLFYNGEDNTIQISFGVKNDLIIINEEMFENFMEEIKDGKRKL